MTIKTVLHTYWFDVRTKEGKAEWKEFKKQRENGPPCHGPVMSNCWVYVKELNGRTVELETTHLFNNQWDTAPIERQTDEGTKTQGIRVFDWALEAIYNNNNKLSTIRRGHWLEQTEEMREIRRNTDVCGYCGKQEPAAKGLVFCPHCIDSEYLKADDLRLTRMIPVDRTHADNARPPLTEAERAYLLPLYDEAQTKGSTARGITRIAKLRRDTESRAERKIRNATTERDGYLWLIDHGLGHIAASNVIFYDHTGRFGFGWRTPIQPAQLSAILDVISEFPFPYDIKTHDGKTLSGN